MILSAGRCSRSDNDDDTDDDDDDDDGDDDDHNVSRLPRQRQWQCAAS